MTSSQALQTVFVLLDIRHLPSELDMQMIEFLVYNNLPFMVIATKADKIAKSKQQNQVKMIANVLKIRPEMVITSSSEQGIGKDKILEYIENKL